MSLKWAWAILYAGVILAANVSIRLCGAIPVGFGFFAPAGVVFAGLALSVRDGLHERAGTRWVTAAIVGGAILSVAVAPSLGVASGAAFLVSELADALVYVRLRGRSRLLALLGSNVVGALVDSTIFLGLAFDSLAFLPGQLLAKSYTTAVVVIGVALARWR